MTNPKFDSIPIEPDTTVLFKEIVAISGYDGLYETWSWDGYWGESLIFTDDDAGGLTDREIRKVVRTSGLVGKETKITVNRSHSGFVFCNFNFR